MHSFCIFIVVENIPYHSRQKIFSVMEIKSYGKNMNEIEILVLY